MAWRMGWSLHTHTDTNKGTALHLHCTLQCTAMRRVYGLPWLWSTQAQDMAAEAGTTFTILLIEYCMHSARQSNVRWVFLVFKSGYTHLLLLVGYSSFTITCPGCTMHNTHHTMAFTCHYDVKCADHDQVTHNLAWIVLQFTRWIVGRL